VVTKSEIKDLKEYLMETYHAKRKRQQEEDQEYIDDTFSISWLRKGINRVRTGKAYRMTASPAEHIITDNPQVFRQGKDKMRNERVVNELNRWARILKEYNPNPYKEHVRNLLARGEAWIYVLHNNNFTGDPNETPVHFIIPDPLLVFVDGFAGETMGVPNRLILCYERLARDIRRGYPQWAWKNMQPGQTENDKVLYLMYWDNKSRYFEADDEALLIDGSDSDGVQENIYGFVPFVHAYSGFGKGSPDGDPSSLAVSRITKCKDLIAEYTAIRSTVNDLIYKYSHPSKDYYYNPSVGTPPVDFESNYSQEPGAFNKVPILGDIKDPIRKGVDMLPDVQLFQHLYNIERDIDKEDPLSMSVMGTSGRQQDMAEEKSLRRYETIVQNSAQAFSKSFGLALRMIEKLPHIKPSGINKGDINGYYDCNIELRAQDPLERDRLATLGDRLWNMGNGAIDLETYHTEYLSYTEEISRRIRAKLFVDKLMMYDPTVGQVMGMTFAEEAGLMKWIQEAMAKNAQMQEQAKGLQTQPPATTQERTKGETKTPLGAEMIDAALSNRGARKPPERYVRT